MRKILFILTMIFLINSIFVQKISHKREYVVKSYNNSYRYKKTTISTQISTSIQLFKIKILCGYRISDDNKPHYRISSYLK
jgi:hypothetical protein